MKRSTAVGAACVVVIVAALVWALWPDSGNPRAGQAVGYAPVKAAPVAAFLGDSYTAGSGASSPAKRWTTLVAAKEGWTERNYGEPGTGYANPGSGSEQAYPARVARIVAARPVVVVVSGGQNDESRPRVAVRNVAKTFAALRTGLPHARIIAVGPSVPDPSTRPLAVPIDQAVRAAARRVHATYISLLDPDPLKPSLLAADHQHPNDRGYAAIAAQVERGLTG